MAHHRARLLPVGDFQGDLAIVIGSLFRFTSFRFFRLFASVSPPYSPAHNEAPAGVLGR